MSVGKKYQIDMCHGPLLGKIIRFAVPLMMANVSALMFNAADLIVLGQYASSESMAAVGAAPAFTTLMLNLFWGISAGVNVLTARYIGAKDNKNVSRTVHTAIAVGCYGGLLMAVLGLIITKPVLRWLAVPDKIFESAALYMWIWCLGIPFMILFSFGSAIMRSMGDTKRPLIFMIIAGIVNVLLNMFFVIVCKMDVAGVAIATKISNALSAILVLRSLSVSGGVCSFVWKKVSVTWVILKDMFRIGLPAGVQGMMFSISNIIIQSTLNSFGWQAIAGSTAALSLEGMVHAAFGAYALAVVSFAGQNHGAKKYKRIMKSIWLCIGCGTVTALVLTVIGLVFKVPLLTLFNPDPEVVKYGILRLEYQLTFYSLLAIMEIVLGALRGLGYSFWPMIISLLGACVFRVVWVWTIFPHYKSLENLFLSYPVSWTLVNLVAGGMLFFVCRNMLLRAKLRQHDDLSVK
ncbi:MAG: MATE family efflux transporter [Lentisphaeria bacterium]|nr:MATE family efflux transporter [Lentisphaeria bacterium]